MISISGIDAFLGLDVGKGEHHASTVTLVGKNAFGRRLPDSLPKPREGVGKTRDKRRARPRPQQGSHIDPSRRSQSASLRTASCRTGRCWVGLCEGLLRSTEPSLLAARS